MRLASARSSCLTFYRMIDMKYIVPFLALFCALRSSCHSEQSARIGVSTFHFRLSKEEMPQSLKVGAEGELLYGSGPNDPNFRVLSSDVRVTCIRPYAGEHPNSCAPFRGQGKSRNVQICVEMSREDFVRMSDIRGFCTFRKR